MLVEDPATTEVRAPDRDALIREARRRQRRRWALSTAAVLVVSGCVGAIVLLVGSDRSGANAVASGGGLRALSIGPLVSLKTAGPLAVGPGGVLYVADVASHRVLVRLSGGRFRVVAGTGHSGYSGDGGPAIRAELSTLTDIAVSPTGRLYIADGGRVRVVDPDGLIRTVAGNGRPVRIARDGQLLTKVANDTPALEAALGSPRELAPGRSWLNLAFSPSGQLYLSTGFQILRLTNRGTLTPVRAVVTTGPSFLRGALRGFGPLAIDTDGNIDVSGVNGWSIWQVSPTGVAHEVGTGSGARRSGGNDSVLERSPDGSVYGEDGDKLLRVANTSLRPAYTFTGSVAGESFELTYFTFGPDGTMYADEIPGGGGFEARQQLLSITRRHEALLWEQPRP
jgi:hypothetical protein